MFSEVSHCLVFVSDVLSASNLYREIVDSKHHDGRWPCTPVDEFAVGQEIDNGCGVIVFEYGP